MCGLLGLGIDRERADAGKDAICSPRFSTSIASAAARLDDDIDLLRGRHVVARADRADGRDDLLERTDRTLGTLVDEARPARRYSATPAIMSDSARSFGDSGRLRQISSVTNGIIGCSRRSALSSTNTRLRCDGERRCSASPRRRRREA